MTVDFSKYREMLARFVSFATVSTDSSYHLQIGACVSWLDDLFEKNGFSVVVESPECNPIIIARHIVNPDFETVLVYGHYDVQPASLNDGWNSNPFVLVERAGKLFGRGVVDNKGQILTHMLSVFSLIGEKKLCYNVVFVIEGNEETGGGGLSRLLHEKPELFDCDLALVSDGEIPYAPVIDGSYRGVINIEVKMQTAPNSLHSGIYGGAVNSASEQMIKLLSSLKDSNGRVVVPGFYDGDVMPNAEQLDECKKMDVLRSSVLKTVGVNKPSFSAATGFVSMLEITGLSSGYLGNGFSNIVPHIASAKINIRLAGNSKPQVIVNSLIGYLKQNVGADVKLDTFVDEVVAPVYLDVKSEAHTSVKKLLEEVYTKPVTINYCGATIPIVSEFVGVLGVDLLSVPLGNDDCNMHGANENLDVELAKLGLIFSERFFSKN